MGSQHPSAIQRLKRSGWQELLGLENSQMFFSHVLHPLALDFAFQAASVEPHRCAQDSPGKAPPPCPALAECWEEPGCFLWQESSAVPMAQPRCSPERELQGCTLIQIYTVFPRMKANPSAAAAFLQGIPHPLLHTARAEGRAWSGVIPLSCGTSAQADQRILRGSEWPCPVTAQVLNKSLSTLRKVTGC